MSSRFLIAYADMGFDPVRTSWKKLVRTNDQRFFECQTCGYRGRDFDELKSCCPSCDQQPCRAARARVLIAGDKDIFDEGFDQKSRAMLFDLIGRTPNIDWLLVTESVSEAQRMFDWAAGLNGWSRSPKWPSNVWLGARASDQQGFDRAAEQLKLIEARIKFVLIEPMRGRVFVRENSGVDWVIASGEPGSASTALHPDWVRQLRDSCCKAAVPFLFAGWGDWAGSEHTGIRNVKVSERRWTFDSRTFSPEGVDYSPRADAHDPIAGYNAAGMTTVLRVGAKRSGRRIDGVTHHQFPR